MDNLMRYEKNRLMRKILYFRGSFSYADVVEELKYEGLNKRLLNEALLTLMERNKITYYGGKYRVL